MLKKRTKIPNFLYFILGVIAFIFVFFLFDSFCDYNNVTWILKSNDFSKQNKNNPIVVIPYCLNNEKRIEYFEKVIRTIENSVFKAPIIFSNNCESIDRRFAPYSIHHYVGFLRQDNYYINVRKKYFSLPSLFYTNEFYTSQHIYFLLKLVFDTLKFNSVIVIESDVIVSTDFYQFFNRFSHEEYPFFTINGYNNSSKEISESDLLDVDKTEFNPWGWGMNKHIWEKYVRREFTYTNNWDYRMEEIRKNHNLISITPKLARTKHIGYEGINFKNLSEREKKEMEDIYISLS